MSKTEESSKANLKTARLTTFSDSISWEGKTTKTSIATKKLTLMDGLKHSVRSEYLLTSIRSMSGLTKLERVILQLFTNTKENLTRLCSL